MHNGFQMKQRKKLIHNEAVIIRKQSMKIKELVQDLDLVSQLEYYATVKQNKNSFFGFVT